MQALVQSTNLAPREAVEDVRRLLAARGPAWRLALLGLAADSRADVAVVAAWDRCVQDRVDAETDPARRARAREELLDLTASARGGNPTTLLGRALGDVAGRRDVDPTELAAALRERARLEHVAAFESRTALLRHVHRVTRPVARALVLCLGLQKEAPRLRAEALGEALFLTARLARLVPELAGGRLWLPVDELTARRVDLQALLAGDVGDGVPATLEQLTAFTRGLYVKGWPLVDELGPVRGRALAFFLRWHAAALAGLEARRFDPRPGPPPAGLLRFGACLAGALRSPEPPPL